jgi:acetolactate synthase-1/2/3 large subunit
MNTTGAQAIVQTLLEQDVELIFGYPGGAIMPTYDALYDVRDRLRHVLVRHEQGATHAAEGYARASNRVGVVLATSGPGATNCITGLANALMDSTPLVCITGQVRSDQLGTEAFQEADVIGLSRAATKWNCQITDPADIPWVLRRAFAIARSGRPGPVLVDITRDAQLESFQQTHPDPAMPAADTTDLAGLAEAAELINGARRPLILAGHGVQLAGASEALRQLAERAGIPVACTLHGLSALPADHPLFVGMLGMHGHYGPNLLTNEADLLIAVGMRFDDRVTARVDGYAPNAKVIHIEIDPRQINRVIHAHVPLLGDARVVLEALLPRVERWRREDWLARFRACAEEEYRRVSGPELEPGDGPLRMAEVIHRLSTLTRGEAVIVSDVGQHQMQAARYYRFRQPRSHLSSGGMGTMGFALPAAIGASLAVPHRPVVAVVGDGGLQMTLQELGTLMQERLPVKIVVLNNHHLGMVRQWQEMFFDARYSFVSMANPDFTTIASGYGISARRVTARAELNGALGEMLASPQAFLLDVEVAPMDKVFPMIPPGAAAHEVRLA